MKELLNRIKEIAPDVKITGEDMTYFRIDRDDWTTDLEFDNSDITDIEAVLDDVKHCLSYSNLKNHGIYRHDYAEIVININSSILWGQFYKGRFNSGDENTEEDESAEELFYDSDKIFFEISYPSDDFERLINLYYSIDEPQEHLTTLQIHNINSVLLLNSDDDSATTRIILDIAKAILFDLNRKYDISLRLVNLSGLENSDEEDPLYDICEKLEEIDKPTLNTIYDKDLVNYYYRAMTMDDNEFKYLAYYQVMECIFDEVFLHENVQDVKQIINSNKFSSYNDNDITQIIRTIEQYNKNKLDRDKLKLVLEKYFRGDIHDEAYIIANKEIIDLLISMKLIQKENDFKDLQRFTNIVYDYRCYCTHSNRTFPARTTYNKTNDELYNYLFLIQKTAERIITNYKT